MTRLASPVLRVEELEDRLVPANTVLSEFVAAQDPAAGSFFGGAIAMAGDYAIVGAPLANGPGASAGAAYIYHRVGGNWVQEAKLLAADASAGALFGAYVAMSGDRVVVGAVFDSETALHAGAAYVFRHDGASWVQEAKLLASDGEVNEWFGASVAIDGDTIVVGAQRENTNGPSSGAAYVYQFGGSSWTEVDKLTAADGGVADFFGSSVAVSGSTVLVGAFGNSLGNGQVGAAYVFGDAGGGWSQTAKLTPGDAAAGKAFGFYVGMDGDTAVIGAPGDSQLGFGAGAAYVFARAAGAWTEQAKLVASDGGAGDHFGRAVAISRGDILVGAPDDLVDGTRTGSAYWFESSTGGWGETTRFVAATGAIADNFGWNVAVSGDYFFVGAPLATDTVGPQGLAYPGNLRLPSVANSPLIVVRGGEGTIGTGLLNVSVATWSPSEIIYTLLSPPNNGVLLLNGVVLSSGSFTQANIDAGRLVYVNDGSDATDDNFAFAVTNADGNLLTSGFFLIQIIDNPVPPTPPLGPAEVPINFPFAPFPPNLDRPERGLAFNPPIPDDRYAFDPSIGPLGQSRRLFTGDQMLLIQAEAIAARNEEILLEKLPRDLFRAAERIFDALLNPGGSGAGGSGGPNREAPKAPPAPQSPSGGQAGPRTGGATAPWRNPVASDLVFTTEFDPPAPWIGESTCFGLDERDTERTFAWETSDAAGLVAAALLVPLGSERAGQGSNRPRARGTRIPGGR